MFLIHIDRSLSFATAATLQYLLVFHRSTAAFLRADVAAASSLHPCFPESLQLPALGSQDLEALRDDLAKRIADASSHRAAADKQLTGVSVDPKLTTNSALTYASSGSARTDLFFKYKGSNPLVDSSPEQINQLLQQVSLKPPSRARTEAHLLILRGTKLDSRLLVQAWQEDSLDTLKLIAHLRDVRDGKGEQKLFHDCVAWMRAHHPLTLIANLREVVEVRMRCSSCCECCISADALHTYHAQCTQFSVCKALS